MIFQISRLRGVLTVVAGGLAVFVAMHYVLGLALGPDAAALFPRQRPLGGPLYERVWRRVSALDRLYHRGQLPPDTRLGMYLGVSTTATGIQRHLLDERATAADRWMVLSGAGLSFENLESVMLPIFFCRLKPAAVVLGVHPQMLAGERYLDEQPMLGKPRVIGRRGRAVTTRLSSLLGLDGLPQHWIVRNHGMVEQFLRGQMYGWRLGLLFAAGVSAEYVCEPATEPWDDDPLWLWNMNDAEDRFAHDQITYWSRQGHFKAKNYDPEGDQARSLVRMIRAYRDLGADVYVVIMPVRSSLRSRIPANAKPCLYEALRRGFPDDIPTVIDLEEAIPDRFYTDHAHLSKRGSEYLSRIVAKRLRAAPGASP